MLRQLLEDEKRGAVKLEANLNAYSGCPQFLVLKFLDQNCLIRQDGQSASVSIDLNLGAQLSRVHPGRKGARSIK